MNLFKTSLLATALIAAGAIAPAHAVNNKTFDVEIEIINSCHVTATENVSFPNRTATAGTVSSTGSVTVQCTNGLAGYKLVLNDGLHSGAIGTRNMQIASGTATISYELRQESATGTIWDAGAVATGDGKGFGTGAPYDQPHIVYATATIPGDALAGEYSDTVTATVTF
ncbi:Csu type fimbrial protein [Lysobacter sp. A289]